MIEVAQGSSKQKPRARNARLPAEPNKWGMTRMEVTIFKFLVDGLTPKEIAEKLHLSNKTVASYMQRVRQRMGARNSTQAILMFDREVWPRPLAVHPLTVLRVMLGREPYEQEKSINFTNWERNPEVYESLVQHTRQKLQSATGTVDPALFERLQGWFIGTRLENDQWEGLLATLRGDAT